MTLNNTIQLLSILSQSISQQNINSLKNLMALEMLS
ncbi:hypothetical protein pb186bvf_014750 [Paramecium bursaria]